MTPNGNLTRWRRGVLVAAAAMALGGRADAAPAAHWAFSAPVRPEPPAVKDTAWVRTPIDRFILARLEEEGLPPAPEADPITFVRRLHLDLTGLPPAAEEVDAFLADRSAGAVEATIERLLASPHYGERWGRHWLDAARYADTNGYEKDRAREMWHWRDWVIDAVNRDLPYDRFIIEQLAGDLLDGATQDQRMATGYLRNSMINEEGAIDPEQFRMEAMFDRMDCIGKSVLGLTLQCAQCHDHKYDPITQREYYQLFAFINNDDELTAPLYTPRELGEIEAIERGIRAIEEEIQQRLPDWSERLERWAEEEARRPRPEWVVLEPHEHGDPGGLSKLTLQRDRSLLAGGHRFNGGTWRVRARTSLEGIRAVRLELIPNANLPHHGPGRSERGLFALKDIQLEVAPAADAEKRAAVAWAGASADFEEPQKPEGATLQDPKARLYGPVRFAADGEERTAWTIDAGPGRRNVDREAVFVAKEPFGLAGGSELTFHFTQEDEIACFRLAVTTADGAAADPLPRRALRALSVPRDQRTEADRAALFAAWRRTVPEAASENERIEALWKKYPEASGTALVLEARRETRETSLLKRGDWLQPEIPVAPDVPAFLHAFPEGAPRNRLGFARWLADPRSPTTARAIVNRIWQTYFGAGLLTTAEDFGRQAPPPSHAGLLDWLACELVDPRAPAAGETVAARPWSLKHIHRLITTSAVYRQSSRVRPDHLERDPTNRLLSRSPRLRVEGEVVRDIALAASGLLNPAVGGPPIYSPAPDFLFKPPTSYMAFPWPEETGANRYRRALYTFRRRSTPYPVLQTFDTPSGDSACVRRMRSNTPLQALVTLNETLFVEASRALARRMAAQGGKDDRERLAYAFRSATGRRPTDREIGHLEALLEKQRHRIAEGWINAAEIATGKTAAPGDLPEGVNPADLAAYAVAARVILNLDETITRE
jgi:hypothetical protein